MTFIGFQFGLLFGYAIWHDAPDPTWLRNDIAFQLGYWAPFVEATA